MKKKSKLSETMEFWLEDRCDAKEPTTGIQCGLEKGHDKNPASLHKWIMCWK